MNHSMLGEVISASVAIIIAASSYLFTKWRERDADWRKWKYDQYKEFVDSISGIIGTDSTPEGNRAFARACNSLHLIGSNEVVNALHAYQDEIRISNLNRSTELEQKLLTNLVREIRKDAAIPNTPAPSEFSVTMWCSGVSERTESLPNSET